MSEQTLLERPQGEVSVEPGKLRDVAARELLIRFAMGAATSAVAAVVSIAFGPRAGGILLAFPAILAASLTLIASEEDVEDAREDARGAFVGAIALGCFACACSLLFAKLPGAAVLALATAVWGLVAVGVYRLAWGGGRGD